MFDDELKQANLAMAELRERLQRLSEDQRRTFEAIDRAKAEYHRLAGYAEALTTLKSKLRAEGWSQAPKKKNIDESRTSNPRRTEVADAALAAIREAGHPLGRSELFAALQVEGVTVQGGDPMKILSTMLWRERDRIVRLRGHGYWPIDKPYPPADYFPASEQPSLL